ncbi:hypothetical protein [Clostridium sp. ZS1]|uniref:hypothetical protein n=1 Tax=Clostridium sp. ZS1 TaxID=2949989 RepID=UPI001DE48911|nr:hypothetical protein [Clostridium sp. ZS1]MBN1067580.1 hypothetical protein [Clostridium botulinum]
MIKLYRTDELEKITQYPKQMVRSIKEIIEVLDSNYGTNRNVNSDLGGYIIVVESKEDVANIETNILKGTIEEYTDVIKSDDGIEHYSSLFLLSSDYSVIVISTKELHELLLEKEL